MHSCEVKEPGNTEKSRLSQRRGADPYTLTLFPADLLAVPGAVVASPEDNQDVRERVQTSEETDNLVVLWTEGSFSLVVGGQAQQAKDNYGTCFLLRTLPRWATKTR